MALNLARARGITGWMDDEELKWLARAARSCRTIVEVGCYQGRSTRALADHCPGVVFAVDPWDGYVNDDGSQAKWITDLRVAHEAFRRNLADHLASGRVVELQGTLETALPTLEAYGLADLVFIDGDHRYEAVVSDIALARSIVRPGGIISGHDFRHATWPGVRRAVEESFPGAFQVCRTIWSTTAPALEKAPPGAPRE